MSYGNINNQGDKGQNAPWQRAMLDLLSRVVINTASGGGTPQTLTPTLARVTNSGTVSTGTKSVSIYNAGGSDGTVLGVTLKPGEIVDYQVGQDTNGLGPVTYDATGTEFLIAKLS